MFVFDCSSSLRVVQSYSPCAPCVAPEMLACGGARPLSALSRAQRPPYHTAHEAATPTPPRLRAARASRARAALSLCPRGACAVAPTAALVRRRPRLGCANSFRAQTKASATAALTGEASQGSSPACDELTVLCVALVVFLDSLVAGCCFSLLPYWASALGVSHPTVTPLRCYALAQALLALLLCPASDRLRARPGRTSARARVPFLLICHATGLVAMLALARATRGATVLWAAAAAGCASVAAPLCFALATDVAQRPLAPSRAWTFSTLALAAGAGFAAGPFLGGAVAASHGLHAAAFAAALAASAAFFATLLGLRDVRLPSEQAVSLTDVETMPRLLALRVAFSTAFHAFSAALSPAHNLRFALLPSEAGALAGTLGMTQLATWVFLAPVAARAVGGARALQAPALALASLAFAAWANADLAADVALPLAAVAVCGALFRTASDASIAVASGTTSAGAAFGRAFAMCELARQMVAPPMASAVLSARGASALGALCAAIAFCASVGAILTDRAARAQEEMRTRDAEEAAADDLFFDGAASRSPLRPSQPSPVSAVPLASAAQPLSAADAGGGGAFSGTVVVRRPPANSPAPSLLLRVPQTPASAALAAATVLLPSASEAEGAEMRRLVEQLLSAEATLQATVKALSAQERAREVAIIEDMLRAYEEK